VTDAITLLIKWCSGWLSRQSSLRFQSGGTAQFKDKVFMVGSMASHCHGFEVVALIEMALVG
jgi:hypothetical protein